MQIFLRRGYKHNKLKVKVLKVTFHFKSFKFKENEVPPYHLFISLSKFVLSLLSLSRFRIFCALPRQISSISVQGRSPALAAATVSSGRRTVRRKDSARESLLFEFCEIVGSIFVRRIDRDKSSPGRRFSDPVSALNFSSTI